ncbi:MAG: nucleotidyltransferase domain-containing protein [Candidatus Babeliales bacterium]|nr:nucleotidyltransferase domain-containing protein [Candidatus Babeliales bacterium]
MISQAMIDEVKNRLIKTYNPVEIYIFGSYAWGHPDDESDLDLLVVVDTLNKNHFSAMADGHKALMDLRLSKDILVYTKDEFVERADNVTTLCYKIKRKGKQIYARA